MLMFSMSSSSRRSCRRPRPSWVATKPADDLLLFLGGRGGHAALDHGARRFVDGLAGELLDEGTAIAFAHSGRRRSGRSRRPRARSRSCSSSRRFGVVHRRAFPFEPAPTATRIVVVHALGIHVPRRRGLDDRARR